MPLTPDEYYARWRRGVENNTDKYRMGIERVRDNPLEKAAQQADFWARRVAEAARNGRFAGGLRSYNFQDWKNITMTVGVTNLATGVIKAQRKSMMFARAYLPFIEQTRDAVRRMNRTTYAERKARANEFMDRLHNNPYRQRGGPEQLQMPIQG